MKKVGFSLLLAMVALSLRPKFAAAVPLSSIQGTVTYGGSKTGQVYVAYYPGPCAQGNVFTGQIFGPFGSPPYDYTLSGLQDGTYCVGAFLDVAGDGSPPEFTDPVGIQPDVQLSGGDQTGIDIALSDPGPMTGIWDGTADVTVTLPADDVRATEFCSYRGTAYIYQIENLVIGPADLERTSGFESCPDTLHMFVAFAKSGDSLDGEASIIPEGTYAAGGTLSNNGTTASGGVSGEFGGAQFDASWIMNKRAGAPVPSVSPWGVLVLALLVAGSSVWMLRRRKRGNRVCG